MKIPLWLLPIIAATLVTVVATGHRFYIESLNFHATWEDEEITRAEDDEGRDAKLEWLRDRVNELRYEHGKELAGWPE